MGLIVEVFKSKLSNADLVPDRLTLVNMEGPFEPHVLREAALLVEGNRPGTLKVILARDKGKQVAMSGCYVATSDSRFTEACERILGHDWYGAVALHLVQN